jgi:DNA-binding transcriptional LysR family regulator
MTLDPRQLSAFLAVVQNGSLGRATEALHMTQPALSRTIRRLELQLGAELFERHSTGMDLTTYGQALLPYAKLLSAEAANAVEEINALRGFSRGVVRVGAVGSAANMLLPAAVQRLLKRWPGLRVQITEAIDDQLAVALVHNDIDLAIAGTIPETETIVRIVEHEFQDTYRVIAGVDHPLQSRSGLTARDLLDHPWVMPPQEATPRRQFIQIMRELGLESPTAAVETRSVGTIMKLIVGNQFLGWMPEPLYATFETAGLVRPLPIDAMIFKRHFFIYRRRRGVLPPAALKLLETLSSGERELSQIG